MDFPDSSVGEESVCNAGDPSSIPGLVRSPGEGKDYLLQCRVLKAANFGLSMRRSGWLEERVHSSLVNVFSYINMPPICIILLYIL